MRSISDNHVNMTEGVEGIHHAARLLLDTRELGDMLEMVQLVLRIDINARFLVEDASLLVVAVKSLIEDSNYVGIPFRIRSTTT